MERAEAFRLRLPLVPQAADIDALGHVSNIVYVRWLQDAGVAHWQALATPEEQARLLWVVARVVIDFRRESLEGEALVAETWVGEARGARFDRHVRILGPAGDVRAEAVTTWVLIDQRSRRPMRVPTDLISRFRDQAVAPSA
jgi:acyl-CoA thioester hydrolase